MVRLNAIARILSSNLSLVVAPGVNFALVFLLARYSTLQEDLLFFFMAGLIGFTSLLDGGCAYKVAGRPSPKRVFVVCRYISDNLSIFLLPVLIGFIGATLFTPFGKTNDLLSVIFISFTALFCGYIKVYSDALKVLALKTPSRKAADQLASVMAIIRLITALSFLNKVPYIFVYAVTLCVELLLNLRLVGLGFGSLLRALRPRFGCRIRVYRDYVQANLAYLLSANLDRILSYYVLSDGLYRTLVILVSIFNMSVLPHKVIENEMLFPSQSKERGSESSILMISLLLASVGALAIGYGLQVIVNRSPIFHVGKATVFAACVWLASTIIFNRSWATKLRSRDTRVISRDTLLAGTGATFAGIFLMGQYELLIPIVLLTYAMINVVFVALRQRDVMRVGYLYYVVCALFGFAGFAIPPIL